MAQLTKGQAYRNPTGRNSRTDVPDSLTIHAIPGSVSLTVKVSNLDNPDPDTAASWVTSGSSGASTNAIIEVENVKWFFWDGGGSGAVAYSNYDGLVAGLD